MKWVDGLKGLMRGGAARVSAAEADSYAKSVSETVARVRSEDPPEDATPEAVVPKRPSFIKAVGRKLQIEGEEDDLSLHTEPWDTTRAPDMITDFAPDEDTLLFVWDDTEGQEEPPMVTVTTDPAASGHLQVCLEDEIIASVSGPEALADADISMIPLSTAQELDLIAK